jgi:Predicted membrane protein
MEKISALIDKLQELKNSNAGLQTISYYTQLLQAEILHQRNKQKQQELKGNNGHVAVSAPVQAPAPAPVAATVTPPAVAATVTPPPPVQIPPPPAEVVLQSNGYAPDRVPVKRPEERPLTATLFDPPPPPQPPSPPQRPANTENNNGIRKELNELIGKHNTSLNDSLRSSHTVEVGEKLSGMAVNDLKNAIGINDKFQFIQELFRGDKTMYERSIKTINESTSLQEAEYWIERELKIKLGWNETDELVSQFYSLVRKRFS